MEPARARTLIDAERARVMALIAELAAEAGSDREAANEQGGDFGDPAQPMVAEGGDDAILASLRERLDALDRADARLAANTFGRSVRSGTVIPDERLEADPAAELTLNEAEHTGGAFD